MATSSHFDEKSGVVQCSTPWGRWWQTAGEIQIEVDRLQDLRQRPSGFHEPVPAITSSVVNTSNVDTVRTRARDVNVDVKPNQIRCKVHGKTIFQGKLCRPVVADETVWTIRRINADETLEIQLVKADPYYSELVWPSLLIDGERFAPDAYTFDQMRRKVDLEKFQIENPGFDFSNANLQKTYD